MERVANTREFILEFAPIQPDEKTETEVKDHGTKTSEAKEIIQISPKPFGVNVLSQSSFASYANHREMPSVQSQGLPRSATKRRKSSKPQKKNSKLSKFSSASDPSTSLSKFPTIITNHQQPTLNLCIENEDVVQRKAQQQEINRSSLEEKLTKRKGDAQISSTTKMALKNFLKQKFAGLNNGKKSDKTNISTGTDVPRLNVLSTNENGSSSKEGRRSPDNESCIESRHSNASTGFERKEISPNGSHLATKLVENKEKEHGTCPDPGIHKPKDVQQTTTGNDSSEEKLAVFSCPESSSSIESQSCPDFNESASGAGEDGFISDAPTMPSDVKQHNNEKVIQDEEGLGVDVSVSEHVKERETVPEITVSDSDVVTGEAGSPVIQEVDILFLDSASEPLTTYQDAEGSQAKVKSGTKTVKTKKSFDCVECGKYFESNRGYKRHLNIHYDIRPHKCDECEKSFRQRGHLEKHKLLHTGEKPFSCQYCGRGFRCKYILRDHERIHTGEKPCKCDTCDQMFRSWNVLSDHLWNAHKLRPPRSRSKSSFGKTTYKCNVCEKIFSWSSALSAHKKTHGDVWAYKCNKCPKVFKVYSNLWNHQRSHSKAKPFECDLCGQHLKRRGNLKRHLLTQHDPEEAELCLKTSQQFVGFRTPKKTAS